MLPYLVSPDSTIIGIDPGVNGAVSFLDTERWMLGVIDMPQHTVVISGKDVKEPSPAALAEILREIRPMLVVCEKLTDFGFHPNPHDLMKMGRWRGQIEGLVAAAQVGFEHPYPASWKAKMGMTANKEHSRLRANALFPGCSGLWKYKKDHDRAEAAVLALYGCLALGVMPTKPITLLPTMDTETE